MKIYGFVHSAEANKSYFYFPALGKFGLLETSNCIKNDVYEFDKQGESLKNPKKCINIQVEQGKITDLTPDTIKIKTSSNTVYALPKHFFIKEEDIMQIGNDVKLHKNDKGVIIYGQIIKIPEFIEKKPDDILNISYLRRVSTKEMKIKRKIGEKCQTILDHIEGKFSSWREVCSDENGFFRAVTLAYIEYLCRESTPYEKFIDYINSSDTDSQTILKYLYMVKCKYGSAVNDCEDLLKNEKNHLVIIKDLRERVAKHVEKNSAVLFPFLTGGLEKEVLKLRDINIRPESYVFKIIGDVLNISITFYLFEKEQGHKITYEKKNEGEIVFVMQEAFCDILYDYRQDTEDIFGRSPFLASFPTNYIISVNNHLQMIYETLSKLSINYDIRLPNYFPEVGHSIANFWKTFPGLDATFPEIQKSCDSLYKTISSNGIISEVLGVCSFCFQNPQSIRASCGHLYCKEDAKDMIFEQDFGNSSKIPGQIFCKICSKSLEVKDFSIFFPGLNVKKQNPKFQEENKNAADLLPKIRKSMVEEDIEFRKKLLRSNTQIDKLVKTDKIENIPIQNSCICKLCGKNKSLKSFAEGHLCLCKKCMQKGLKGMSCPYCNRVFTQIELKKAKIICGACFVFREKGVIIRHDDHIVCQKCEITCSEFNCCIVCNEQLSKEEEKKLLDKYFIYCFGCKTYNYTNSVSMRKCSCNLCNKCYDRSINENGGACNSCNGQLVLSKKTCEICTEHFLRDEMLTLNCDHYFCNPCLKQYISTQISSGNEEIICPSCKMVIDGNIIQNLITPAEWDLFNKASIRKKYKLTDCPKCGSYFETSVNSSKCISCKYQFCIICKEKAHKGNCDDQKIKNIIKDLEGKGERLAQCPGCKYPYSKDEGCEHVSCTNPQCLVEFCFTCSCLRGPTLSHGNHYHREDCTFYSAYNGVDKMVKDCNECKKLNKLCPRPMKLKNPRRFAENEN
ncbi:hypothetical protein SteCoe_13641 [Stentor coeruleus]|uniref:RBR-type E3 ubiquitin transferase n=1 Tax=Stentor coeruleus TaxID=5963 RepID=A0A1R2C7W8_9CILI|nr:hypothetical protein SteCoe_13641 [Stentor coeruleus]